MKRIAVFLAFVLLFSVAAPASLAAKVPEMTIHAIRLGELSKGAGAGDEGSGSGDSVLLESKGKYLLMDTGDPGALKNITAYLDKKGIKKLDLYLSHIHVDHYGNIEALTKKYKVGRIYFPHSKYAKQDSNHSYFYKKLIPRIKAGSKNKKIKITYLKTGRKFQVGDAKAQVIGPVNTFKLSNYKSGTKVERENDYTNNYSLSTMITCGTTKFFTAGDIQHEEEKALIKKYGKKALKADIMKLSHHGVSSTSNAESFMKAVAPQYSFVQNGGLDKMLKASDGRYFRRSYTNRVTANKTGICLSPDDEKKHIIIKVTNDKVDLYRGNTAAKNRLKGLVTVQGGDGRLTQTNQFYIDAKTGKLQTGIQTIGSKKYDFGTGGCMIVGLTKTNGKYVYLRYDGEDFRYHQKDGSFATGFVNISKAKTSYPNRRVYFDPETGYAVRGKSNKDYDLVTIGKKKYGININGTIHTYGWNAVGSNYRYFDKKTGAMQTGWFNWGAPNYYVSYLNENTGLRLKGFNKIGDAVYYFNPSGILRTSGRITEGNTRYAADKDGKISIINDDKTETPLTEVP